MLFCGFFRIWCFEFRLSFEGRSIEVKFIIYVFLTILTLAQTGQAQTAKSMTVPEIAVYNKPDREKMLYEAQKKKAS